MKQCRKCRCKSQIHVVLAVIKSTLIKFEFQAYKARNGKWLHSAERALLFWKSVRICFFLFDRNEEIPLLTSKNCEKRNLPKGKCCKWLWNDFKFDVNIQYHLGTISSQWANFSVFIARNRAEQNFCYKRMFYSSILSRKLCDGTLQIPMPILMDRLTRPSR